MQRFWNKIKKSDGCWEWTANKDKNGYGKIKISGKTIKAHRYAWELTHFQNIPEGMFVCHNCDNPSCVRPDHLFLGTPLDNMRDKIAKGRLKTTSGPQPNLQGEKNPAAILTRNKVEEIRQRYLQRNITQRRLGEIHGVAESTIWMIVNNRTWKEN